MKTAFPISFLVTTPEGTVPLDPERARVPLPAGPDGTNPSIHYGPYFEALLRFLSRESFRPLLDSLTERLGREAALNSIRDLEIISEKHGALYHVAHLRTRLEDETCELALNSAVTPGQKAAMAAELATLSELRDRFGLPYLPRQYRQGEAFYEEHPGGERRTLSLFLAEWFDGYHEFHLTRLPGSPSPRLRIWAPGNEQQVLSSEEARALYAEASHILTSYLDPSDFRQIYPWHHAAGDFIVRRRGGPLDVRMVTARGYKTLPSLGAGFDEKWIGPVHFLLNATIRMRLDRYDGTGDPAWAESDCIEAVISGFLTAWEVKAGSCSSVPSSGEMLEVLRSFTSEDWLALTEIVLEDGAVEEDEIPFLLPRMREHASSLAAALARC